MDEIYGYSLIEVRHGNTFTIVCRPPNSSKSLSDYDVAFDIVNRHNKEIVLGRVPIPTNILIIPLDVIESLSGRYLINVYYTDKVTIETEVSSVEVQINK